MNFLSVDVETANESYDSICQVGIAVFQDSRYLDGFVSLVNPETHFLNLNVSIHGIDEDAVIDAPRFAAIYPILIEMLNGQTVVTHTHFDRVSLNRACEAIGQPTISCRWLDSARVARRAYPQHRSGLRPIADHLGIEFKHHDALEDARCAGEILCRAVTDTAISLEDWFARVEQPIYGKIERPASDPLGRLHGEIIAFTGALSIQRSHAAQLAAAVGCEVGDGVTKHTTLLVVGNQDARMLNGKDISSKHAKARDLVAKGQPLRIISEADFHALLTLRNATPSSYQTQ